ncbi:MAG: ABC transporter permease [Anaerolineales bacterium]|nr:ABC transporter permease [Anaerolineales bacterium]
MKLGSYEVKLEKKVRVTGWEATTISLLAILTGLALMGLIFLQDGVHPLTGYRAIFSYAFANQFGLPLTINRSIFILLCTCAFIVPMRAGLWNIGMAGQLYGGALVAFAVALALGAKGSQNPTLPPGIIIALMMLGALLGGAVIGAIPGFLKGWFNTNEIVVSMMLNSIVFWLIAYMIKEGGPFMGGGGEGEGFKLSESIYPPMALGGTFTIPIALGLAALLYFMFAKTTLGYQIKAFGLSPSAAKYAGISPHKVPLLVFILGGMFAGLAGFHYFAAVPGVYKIPLNYGDFGDLSFYGIICGLISQGNPLAAIPIALLFGGLTNGGRFVQGQLQLGYGIDYALLGVLMITLVAFQFFYRNTIVWKKMEREP